MARVALEALPHVWYLRIRPCEINPDAHNGEIGIHVERMHPPKCGDIFHDCFGRAYDLVHVEKLHACPQLTYAQYREAFVNHPPE